ncbi:MAG TPA: hypothetical protein VGQ98_10860 [Gemmatimonadaceae bacterium]|nr:hypothetical protein [Gemmatimonadaceae bacterium]
MTGSRSHLAQPSGIFFLLIAGLVITAAGPCAKDLAGPIAPSEWGGEHIGLTISDASATLEYDCASGTIDQKIAAATDGTFTAIGTHTRGHGGPIMLGEVPDRHPARYDGWTDGETMKLTVTLTDTGDKLGDFALIRGQSPRVFRCL